MSKQSTGIVMLQEVIIHFISAPLPSHVTFCCLILTNSCHPPTESGKAVNVHNIHR